MKRFWPVLLVLFAWFGIRTATADGPLPHPVMASNPNAACVHCHESPHATAPDRPKDSFDACASCHTEVHWQPSTFTVERHALLTFGLEGRHATVGCQTCHVDGQLQGLPSTCDGCHIDRHRGLLGDTCTECHSVAAFKPVVGFVHARTGFTLEGPHATTACADCHAGANGQALREGRGGACTTCHTPEHGDLGGDCASCHALVNGNTFAAARGSHTFDHRTTGFPLERRHAAQRCGSCHVKGQPKPLARCESCHVTPHKGQLGGQCQDCHRPDRWSLVRFDHDLTGWTLRGAHQVAPCASCHQNQQWLGVNEGCWNCHASDAARAPMTVDAHRFGRSECQDCHSLWRWAP